MNTKFILFTYGRTGSTAILDELNNINSIVAVQELFIKMDFDPKKRHDQKEWPIVPPYNYWKLCDDTLYLQRGQQQSNKELISLYLDEAERLVFQQNALSFGFKILSHHFIQNEGLLENLIKRRYKAVYLKRNMPRMVISGLIARQRGAYNVKGKFHDDKRYEIDLEEFKKLIKWGNHAVKNDLSLLKENGFEYVIVSYEEYIKNRDHFFKLLLDFLNVRHEIPTPSSYSIMIKDLKHTVANYEEILDYLQKSGIHIQ